MSNCENYVSEEDIRALKESEQHIEHVASSRDSTGDKALSVTGTIRGESVTNRTLDGLEELYQNALSNIGYQQMGDYATGINMTARNQIVFYDGSWYIYRGDLPHVTTGATLPEDGGIWSETNPDGLWVMVDSYNYFKKFVRNYFSDKLRSMNLEIIDGVFSDNPMLPELKCVIDMDTLNVYARLDGKSYQIKQGDSPLDEGWIIATNKLNDFDIEGDGDGDIKIVQNLLDFAKRFGVTNLDFNIKNGKPLVLSKEIHVWTGLTISNFTAVRGVYRASVNDASGSTLVYTYGNVTINNINYDDKNYAANPPIAVWPDESTPNQTHYIAIRVSHRAGTHDVSPDGETPLSEPIEAPLYVNGGRVVNACGTFFGGSKANSVITTDIVWGQFNDHAIYLSNDQDDDPMKMGRISAKGGAINVPRGARSNGAFKFRGSNFRGMLLDSIKCEAPSVRLVAVQSDNYNKGNDSVLVKNCHGIIGGVTSCASAISDFEIDVEGCNFKLSANSYCAIGGTFDDIYNSKVVTQFKDSKLAGETEDITWGSLYNLPNGSLIFSNCELSEYAGVYVTLGLGDIQHIGGSISNSVTLTRNSFRKGTPARTTGKFIVGMCDINSPSMRLVSNNSDVNYPILQSHSLQFYQNYGNRAGDIYLLGDGNKNYSGNNVITYDSTLKDAVAGVMQRYDYHLFSPVDTGKGLSIATAGITSSGDMQLARSIFNIKSVTINKQTFTYDFTFHKPQPSNAYMVIFSTAPASLVKRADGFTVKYNSLIPFEFSAF